MKKLALFSLLIILNGTIYAQKEWNIALRSKFDITSTPKTKAIKFTVVIPQNREGKQDIKDVSFSREPNRIYEEDGNKYAEFIINDPMGKELIWMLTTMKIYKCDLNTMKKDKNILKVDSLQNYLMSERYIDVDDENIRQKASELKGSNDAKTVENIFNYIYKNTIYKRKEISGAGSVNTLETGEGKCAEASQLFVALCRANSIPSRYVYGYLGGINGPEGHAWTEAYLEEKGWVPFDATPFIDKRFFKRYNDMRHKYICFSDVRNAKTLGNHHFYIYRWSGERPSVKYTIAMGSLD